MICTSLGNLWRHLSGDAEIKLTWDQSDALVE